MADIQIYIGDDMLDLFPGAAIALTFQVADIGDLSSRNVSYTNQFTVPYTQNNDLIYESARDIRSTTDFPYRQQLVRIVQNGVEVCSNGIHVLKKASKGYQLFVLFREAGFFKTIEDKKLWDLNPVPFKQRFDDARTYKGTTSGLVHPICYSGRLLVDAVANKGMVKIPFWYYKDIIDQIFIDASYSNEGVVFSNTKYQQLVVNASGSIAGYQPGFVTKRSIDVSVITTQVIAIGDGLQHDVNFTGVANGGTNPDGYWDGTSKFLSNDADIAANQVLFDTNVRFNLTFTGAGTQDIRVRLISGGTTILDVVDLTGIGAAQTARLDYTGDFPAAVSFPYQLNGTGNGLKITIQRINATVGNVNVTAGNMQIYPLTSPSKFTSGGINPYAYYVDLLPDMTQSDFIKDFMIRFGLLCSERDNVVTFKSYNEIIATVTGKDLTTKRVNDTEDISFNPLAYAQQNIFEYASNDDISESVDGTGSIDIDNDNINLSKTIYSSPFSKTLTATVIQILCANIPIRDPVDDPEYLNYWNADAGPRLLLVRDNYSYEPTYPVGAASASYKVAYFEDINAAYQMTFQEFLDDHYNLLTEILQKAKLLNRSYVLNENDIATLSFLEPVFDADSFFLLNIVGPFQPGKKTKINMLKIG